MPSGLRYPVSIPNLPQQVTCDPRISLSACNSSLQDSTQKASRREVTDRECLFKREKQSLKRVSARCELHQKDRRLERRAGRNRSIPALRSSSGTRTAQAVEPLGVG